MYAHGTIVVGEKPEPATPAVHDRPQVLRRYVRHRRSVGYAPAGA